MQAFWFLAFRPRGPFISESRRSVGLHVEKFLMRRRNSHRGLRPTAACAGEYARVLTHIAQMFAG